MKDISRLARLEMLKASVLDCISEGINMGDMVARVEAEIKKEREAVRWSCVCPIVNGCATDAVYEGTEADCADTRTSIQNFTGIVLSHHYIRNYEQGTTSTAHGAAYHCPA